jgi:hypothetical protein
MSTASELQNLRGSQRAACAYRQIQIAVSLCTAGGDRAKQHGQTYRWEMREQHAQGGEHGGR